jgi:hypothetical protein
MVGHRVRMWPGWHGQLIIGAPEFHRDQLVPLQVDRVIGERLGEDEGSGSGRGTAGSRPKLL